MSSKKKLALIFIAILLAFNASFAVFYFFILSPAPISAPAPDSDPPPPEVAEPKPAATELSDEYYSVLFNYGDAIDLCSMEAKSRNNNLIQLTVNERSTRFKSTENMYLVKLDSQVGTPLLYDEKSHTCEIDPNTQGVAFYKEITRRKAVRPQ